MWKKGTVVNGRDFRLSSPTVNEECLFQQGEAVAENGAFVPAGPLRSSWEWLGLSRRLAKSGEMRAYSASLEKYPGVR